MAVGCCCAACTITMFETCFCCESDVVVDISGCDVLDFTVTCLRREEEEEGDRERRRPNFAPLSDIYVLSISIY